MQVVAFFVEMDKRRSGAVKYVVVNPEYEIQLQEGDIM